MEVTISVGGFTAGLIVTDLMAGGSLEFAYWGCACFGMCIAANVATKLGVTAARGKDHEREEHSQDSRAQAKQTSHAFIS